MKKEDFYDVKPLLKVSRETKSPVIVIVGGKGNGKTFGIIEYFLDIYLKTGKILRYLRRYRESITPKAIQSLLLPQWKNITIMTGGKYNNFTYIKNRFYLCKRDSDGKILKKDKNPFIVCSALNSTESFTGADEGTCSAIFFDEFISREKILQDEFLSLMIFHNNCIRNRTDEYTPLILVGNTMSRHSTLAKDFGINLYDLKKGTITKYYNKKDEILAICEYCDSTAKMELAGEKIYSRYDDKKIKMIYTGDWSIGNFPRIKERYIKSSDVLFTVFIKANENIKFEIRLYESYIFGYISRFSKDDRYDVLMTNAVTPLKPDIINFFPDKNIIFKRIKSLILTGQTFFCDGECGELFRDAFLSIRGCDFIKSVYK